MELHERKLKIVMADIKKRLPRLTELTRGCAVRVAGQDYEFLNFDYSRTNRNLEPNCDCINLLNEMINVDIDKVKIIGHKPTFNDFLEWLMGYFGHGEIRINKNGELSYNSDGDVTYFGVVWDLSKPYLEDQSLELIAFAHRTIVINND